MYDQEYYKKWYKKTREKQLLWGKEYYKNHKEHILQMHKNWAKRNVDQTGSVWRKYGRRRRIKNPNIDKEYRLRKKARLKKIFFLVGLPRAGNTLLSSILNQNPDIAVTPNSLTPDILYHTFQLKNGGIFKNFPDHLSLNNIAHHVLDYYYKDWKQSYIIDRSPWGTPTNLKILKETQKNIKIIVLTRDLIEVLASHIRWSHKNPNNFIDRSNFKTRKEQCDYLMNLVMISKNLQGIKNLLSKENKSLCHFVKYNDLVKNPQRIIKEIYDYLEIPSFEHRYTNLDQFEVNGIKYNDTSLGKGLHSIRTDCIRKSEDDAYELIPDAVVKEHRKEWLL